MARGGRPRIATVLAGAAELVDAQETNRMFPAELAPRRR